MTEKKHRGRPKSDGTEFTTHCTITDPLMHPFYIKRDSYNFEVIEISTSTRGFKGKKVAPKEVENTIGYYTSFKGALNCIAKRKFYKNKDSFTSIQSYINAWGEVKNGLKELLNQNEI